MIRRWMASGATPVDIARWITEEYADAKDEITCSHLGHMLCAVMSTEDTLDGNSPAMKCASMFRMPQIRNVSLGEASFLGLTAIYGQERTDWLDNFNAYFANTQPFPTEKAPKTRVTRALANCYNSNIVTVDEKNSIYFFRDESTRVWLMIVNHRDGDILIDEEEIGRQPAFYFTESDHFISPVWMIRQVAKILEHILCKIGYPPIKIHKKVIFDHPNATLIDESIFRENGKWNGVEVVTLKGRGVNPYMPATLPIIDMENKGFDGETELCVMLYMSVMATAELLQCFPLYKNCNVTDAVIEEWCDKRSLFKPVNWDIILHDDFDD